MSDSKIPSPIVTRIPDRFAALGIACHFLARRENFTTFKFGEFVNTVDGQITRNHYYFAFVGQKMVGYAGYAVYSHEDARKFATTGVAPPDDRASGQDVLWLLTLAATDAVAVDSITRQLSHDYAGRRMMTVRMKADGRRRFVNLPIRDRLATKRTTGVRSG
jgi:hemolysin-activating ACP:hemolysin acyltransferase